jgi:hypothetical protein
MEHVRIHMDRFVTQLTSDCVRETRVVDQLLKHNDGDMICRFGVHCTSDIALTIATIVHKQLAHFWEAYMTRFLQADASVNYATGRIDIYVHQIMVLLPKCDTNRAKAAVYVAYHADAEDATKASDLVHGVRNTGVSEVRRGVFGDCTEICGNVRFDTMSVEIAVCGEPYASYNNTLNRLNMELMTTVGCVLTRVQHVDGCMRCTMIIAASALRCASVSAVCDEMLDAMSKHMKVESAVQWILPAELEV